MFASLLRSTMQLRQSKICKSRQMRMQKKLFLQWKHCVLKLTLLNVLLSATTGLFLPITTSFSTLKSKLEPGQRSQTLLSGRASHKFLKGGDYFLAFFNMSRTLSRGKIGPGPSFFAGVWSFSLYRLMLRRLRRVFPTLVFAG